MLLPLAFLEEADPLLPKKDHLKKMGNSVAVPWEKRKLEYYANWRKNNKQKYNEGIEKWRKLNPEKLKIYRRNAYLKNKSKIREYKRPYEKNKYKTDEIFRLKRLARCRYRDILKSKGFSKRLSTFKAIGCTPEYLKQYIQSLFKENMTWDNYGEWEIDHIVPLGLATNREEIEKLSHYTNLQPLWRFENRSKSKGGTLKGNPQMKAP